MAKSSETFNKKEKEKKRQKKQQDKKYKAEERKANATKGKSLEDMMAYIDENGNITNVKPTGLPRQATDLETIQIATPKKTDEPADLLNNGVISFYNTGKGYGFIRDEKSRENIFFHVSSLSYQAQENDKVTFTIERGPKGNSAVQISKKV